MALYLLPTLLCVTYEREAFLSMFKRPVDTSGESRPSDKESGGAVSKKIFFRPFGPHFGLKLGGGGGCCSPGPSARSANGRNFLRLCSHYGGQRFVSSVNTYRICDFPF